VQLPMHERIHDLTEWPVREAVLHSILNDGLPRFLTETVGVDPALIGTSELRIHKFAGRFPADNLGLPVQGDPKETQPIVNERPLAEVQRLWRQNFEAEFWWCNTFQVRCLSKKRKNLFPRERKAHRGFEHVRCLHVHDRSSTSSRIYG
jgi:hypothetical protein